MSTDRNLERTLTRLLADEAPVRGPEHLADAILSHTGRQRPRPPWLVLLTGTPMRLEPEVTFGSRSIRSLGVVGIGALILVLALTAIAVGASLLPRPSTLVPPDRGVFSVTGQMAWPNREDPTATLLADGRVLVIGGAPTGPGTWPVLGECLGSTTGEFTPGGALGYGRTGHAATLLPDGRVFVFVGSWCSPTARGECSPRRIWDPASLSFPEVRDVSDWGVPEGRPLDYTATPIPDGRVRIVAYDLDGVAVAGSIWDPTRDYSQSQSLDALPSLPSERYFARGTTLTDGRVLVAGGVDADGNPTTDAMVWDPQTGTLSPTGSMAEARSGHTQTLLPDGRVLVAGGFGPAAGSGIAKAEPLLASAEIWDPQTSTFSPTGSMQSANATHAAVLLNDGRVLIVGGKAISQRQLAADTDVDDRTAMSR